MIGFLCFCLGVLVALASVPPATAGSLVTVTGWSSSTISGGVFSGESSSSIARDTYFHAQEVFDRSPLRNRVEWRFDQQTSDYERMAWEVDAFSVFKPETMIPDRNGGVIILPAFYARAKITAEVSLTFSEPVYVRASIEATGIRGVKKLQLDYFGHAATYEIDPATAMLLPSTTFAPATTTADALDVLDFTDWFMTTGDAKIELDFRSAYIEDGSFLDGELRFSLEFAKASDWRGDYNFDRRVNGADFLDWQRLDGTAANLDVLLSDFGSDLPIPGDYNFDRRVNGADFLDWQRSGAAPNDLADWQANFGVGVTAELLATVVPEPTSAALLLVLQVGVVAIFGRRCRGLTRP